MEDNPVHANTNKLEATGIYLPPVIFGTSGLGNLYQALTQVQKLEIVKEYMRHANGPLVFDSAGKYGAGLAFEAIGECLRACNVEQQNVIISNKLAWLRTELTTPEPTFEPGVWKDLKHDAVQDISYDGIVRCFNQGNELLGSYIPQMVSVHDPDEFMATATSEEHAAQLYAKILDAYKALADLKAAGKVAAIGVGAKSWKIIEKIAGDVALDWVMIANSFTIKTHPQDLLAFMENLKEKNIPIINSAVFHAGFLMGGDYHDYKPVNRQQNPELFTWRDAFFSICKAHQITPAHACVQFALNAPGVVSIALSTTSPHRIKENLDLAHQPISKPFWDAMKAEGLIRADYNYV